MPAYCLVAVSDTKKVSKGEILEVRTDPKWGGTQSLKGNVIRLCILDATVKEIEPFIGKPQTSLHYVVVDQDTHWQVKIEYDPKFTALTATNFANWLKNWILGVDHYTEWTANLTAPDSHDALSITVNINKVYNLSKIQEEIDRFFVDKGGVGIKDSEYYFPPNLIDKWLILAQQTEEDKDNYRRGALYPNIVHATVYKANSSDDIIKRFP